MSFHFAMLVSTVPAAPCGAPSFHWNYSSHCGRRRSWRGLGDRHGLQITRVGHVKHSPFRVLECFRVALFLPSLLENTSLGAACGAIAFHVKSTSRCGTSCRLWRGLGDPPGLLMTRVVHFNPSLVQLLRVLPRRIVPFCTVGENCTRRRLRPPLAVQVHILMWHVVAHGEVLETRLDC